MTIASPQLREEHLGTPSRCPCRALAPRLKRFPRVHRGQLTGYRIDVDTDRTLAELGDPPPAGGSPPGSS